MGEKSLARVSAREDSMCILVNDPAAAAQNVFANFEHTHYRDEFKDWTIEHAKDVFVISSALGLADVAQVIHKANAAHRLRAILVREETNQNWITRILNDVQLRTLRNLLVHSGWAVPQRVLTAWKYGAQHKLIADAAVFGSLLFVQDCSLKTYKVPFEAIKSLSRIPVDQREKFVISEEGASISWPDFDVDLDLDSVRIAIDPVEMEKAKARRLMHDERFGIAVATVRKNNNLKQHEITGLCDRQLRRIEKGEHATFKALEYLAAAHKMTLQDYLAKVAEEAQKQPFKRSAK